MSGATRSDSPDGSARRSGESLRSSLGFGFPWTRSTTMQAGAAQTVACDLASHEESPNCDAEGNLRWVTMLANGKAIARRRAIDGQCHRKRTASREVRVKRCGKSAPRGWRQSWQGKPHRQQGQTAGGPRSRARPRLSPAGRPLLVPRHRRGDVQTASWRNGRHRCKSGQNSAYKAAPPTDGGRRFSRRPPL